MATLATLSVKVLADTSAMQAGLQKAGSSVSKFGDKTATLGKNMSKFVTLPLLGAGVAAVKAFDDSRKVAAQTEAAIKSTGGAAKVTAKQIASLSEAISKKSGIDDEAIQSGANLLLTFTNIRNGVGKSNDIFHQSTRLLTDMSVAMGTDVKSGAIQLGKALNDPIKGITALTRVGVAFTDQQKKQITTFVESGKRMAAQKIILAELKKEFGGSAAAQATAISKMRVSLDNMAESLGEVLIPIVDKAAKFLSGLAKKFQSLSPHQKEMVVRFAAIAAAAGPLLFIGGKLVKVFGGLIGGVAKLVGGFGKLVGSMAGVGAKAADATTAVGKVAPAMSRMAMLGQGSLLVLGAAFIAASATIIATKQRVKELTTELLTAKTAWNDLEPQVRKNAGTLEGTALQFGVLNRESRAQAIAAGNLISVQQNQYRGVRDLNKVLLDGNQTLSEGEKASIKSALATRNFALANTLLRREAQEAKAAIAAQGRATDSLSRGAKAGLEGNEAIARGMEHVRAAAERARKHTKDLDTSYTTLAGRKPAMLEAGVKTQKAHSDLNKWTAAIREVPGSVDTKANFETSAAHAKLEKLIADYRRKKAEIEGTINVAVTGGNLPKIGGPSGGGGGGGGGAAVGSPQQYRTLGMAAVTSPVTVTQIIYGSVIGSDLEKRTAAAVYKGRRRKRRL